MLLFVAAMSTAQAQEGKTVIGPPGFSCGKWTNTPKRTADHERLKQWIFGYLSGANIESGGADFLRDKNADGMTAWIDNYCRRNPPHAITQAIFSLIIELRSGLAP